MIMDKTLKEFKPGETGTVVRITGQGGIRRRLLDMGITPGTEISMRKVAPLGDPIEITVRGYQLSLRKSEAEIVLMNISGGIN